MIKEGTKVRNTVTGQEGVVEKSERLGSAKRRNRISIINYRDLRAVRVGESLCWMSEKYLEKIKGA